MISTNRKSCFFALHVIMVFAVSDHGTHAAEDGRENSEAKKMEQMGIPFCSMPQALNHFVARDKKTLVISGTHGKTTTSSILAWMLYKAGLDPSFMIGGILQNFDSNFRLGGGDYMIIEGDEYDTAFFDKGPKFMHYRPDTALYRELEKAAKRIRCWPAVRQALLTYLETKVRPDLQPKKKHKTSIPSSNWPLPPCDLLLPNIKKAASLFPNTDVLTNVAIYEKRPDDVLKWYHPGRKNYLYHDTDDSVAEAVKSTHPDEALSIWKQIAEWEIARVKPAAYKVAAPYLKKIRALYQKQKRTDEWNSYLTALRRQHKAKRRLIEILDSL